MAGPRTNMERSSALKRKLGDLPTRPGVYLYRDKDGNLLYVGKAKVLRNRVKSYFQNKRLDAKTRRLVARIWDLEFIVCSTELEALVLENNLIKEHQPPYNIFLRDDKTYPYIKLTWKNAFPQLFVTRSLAKDGSLYFGPFFPASTAYRTVELAKRFFQLRDCDLVIDGKRARACLQYQLHRCTAPCIGAVKEEAYREQVKGARLFLDGKREELKARIETAMWRAAEAQAYEQAAQHRDALQQLDAWFAKQKAATLDQEDTDLYGSAVLDGRACIHRLVMREGRMVGRHEYMLEDVDHFGSELMAEVLQRVYAEEPVPAKILVEIEPEGVELLREWLGSLRGSSLQGGPPGRSLNPSETGERAMRDLCVPPDPRAERGQSPHSAPHADRKPKILVPQRGEKVELLAMAQENARLALERKFEPMRLNQAVLEGLQAFLGLAHLPRRIECFDISHGQGHEVVASCVVFGDGAPDKANYRRYKISSEQNDDYSNMFEAVKRRYRRLKEEGKELPDLVLIDGGLGQLHAAEAALKELDLDHQERAALAKKEELVYRPGSSEPLRIPKSSPVLQLLQRIRDEAHRFAVTYHRALRAKRTLHTELTKIPGIGEATAKKLLQTFGSVQKVREAEEAALVETVGKAAAAKVCAWRTG